MWERQAARRAACRGSRQHFWSGACEARIVVPPCTRAALHDRHLAAERTQSVAPPPNGDGDACHADRDVRESDTTVRYCLAPPVYGR